MDGAEHRSAVIGLQKEQILTFAEPGRLSIPHRLVENMAEIGGHRIASCMGRGRTIADRLH